MPQTQRQIRSLPCKLTTAEFLDRGRSLSQVVQDITTETERQNDHKSQMKAKLAGLTAQQTWLASIVSRGEEMRDIEVSVEQDETALMVRTYRNDTGEVIEERPMRENERQRVLPGVE